MQGSWSLSKEVQKEESKLEEKSEKNNIVEASFEGIGEAFVFALFDLSKSIVWYVDSGVSKHLSHNQKWFQNYETISLIKIYMGHDNFAQETISKGNI